MKKSIFITLFSLFSVGLFACPVCDKQQPKILQGIAHGAGPDGNVDYAIVIAMSIIVLITLFYSVKYIVQPKETNSNHIKRTILKFD
ncbi:hypothetical protein SAMN05444396_10453 [Flavobacterium segetis]|uniref:Cbb3-type cytochrome oxidase component FixQ n=1 Tax=Flavobacterium segetis TaxID=271157 RepID=A0A1M5GP84_9FLAO|nr:hypothetical protein [Flavobacterium segetis]SHG05332.1 hypothetical protein SAMN05444396_10453 [Flavobacterium segetis]